MGLAQVNARWDYSNTFSRYHSYVNLCKHAGVWTRASLLVLNIKAQQWYRIVKTHHTKDVHRYMCRVKRYALVELIEALFVSIQ